MTTGQHPQSRNGDAGGTIGVVSGELTRYADFSLALLHILKPPGTKLAWVQGVNISHNCNRLVKNMVGDWLWMIGDDHIFDPDILVRLLEHDADVVVPLCLKRSAPFDLVIYSGENEEGQLRAFSDDLPESGLVEVHAAGQAGMLVRRHVLEAIPDPVFETYGTQNEDIVFCRKIREAGFKIWCDVDTQLGHIGLMHVWPKYQDDSWGVGLNVGDGQEIPLKWVRPVLA